MGEALNDVYDSQRRMQSASCVEDALAMVDPSVKTEFSLV